MARVKDKNTISGYSDDQFFECLGLLNKIHNVAVYYKPDYLRSSSAFSMESTLVISGVP